MGWRKINPRASAPDRLPPVSVSIRDGGGGKFKLNIRISQDFARKGGFSDNRTSRADIFVGEGSDAGKIKVEETRSGGFTVHPAKVWGPLSIIIAIQPGWPKKLSPTPCAAEIVPGGGIAFRLPWDDQSGASAAGEATAGERSPVEPSAPPQARDGQASDSGRGWIDSDAGEALVFTHGGKEITLGPRAHAVAMKLYAAMGRGFMPYDTLMEAAGIKHAENLRNAVSLLRTKLKPLGLEIEAVPKLGYVMREKQAAPAAAEAAAALPIDQAGAEASPKVLHQESTAPEEVAALG